MIFHTRARLKSLTCFNILSLLLLATKLFSFFLQDNILSSESLADEMKNITPATIAAASNECQVENEFTLSMWTDDPYNILEEELLSISKNTALNQENLSHLLQIFWIIGKITQQLMAIYKMLLKLI